MFPPGHVGIALALYAPIGFVLLMRGRARLAVTGTVVIAGLTLLPDVDKWLPWMVHRGRTHTLWFALGTGVSLGAVAALFGGYRYRDSGAVVGFGAFGLCVGTLAILAHLLGDVITPMGLRPYYPLSETTYTFGLVFASDPTANARLFAVGCVATVAQVLLGVGLGPATSGGSTLGEALRVFVEEVRYGPADRPDASAAGHERSSVGAGHLGFGGDTDD